MLNENGELKNTALVARWRTSRVVEDAVFTVLIVS